MSFILDALKKSEAERQRQSGPTLLELRVTQPRRRYPAWALWVALLLALNVAVLLYAIVRRPTAVPAQTAAIAAAAATPPVPSRLASSSPPVASAAVRSSAPSIASSASGTVPGTVPGTATVPPPAVTAVAPLAPAAPAAPVGSAAQPAATARGSANPADDEPAVAAARTAAAFAVPAPAPPTDYAALPNLASLSGNLPSLQLDLLDYSDVPGERYALINMHRVREGDVLPEGPRVLAITRDGVAMDYNGQDFMLRPSTGGSP